MTIAQQLVQKGIEKGIQLGEQRGIEKGRNEASWKWPNHAPERHLPQQRDANDGAD